MPTRSQILVVLLFLFSAPSNVTFGQTIELEGYLITEREIEGTSLSDLQNRVATSPSTPTRVSLVFEVASKTLSLSGDLNNQWTLQWLNYTPNTAATRELWLGEYYAKSKTGDVFISLLPSEEAPEEIEFRYNDYAKLIVMTCRLVNIEY